MCARMRRIAVLLLFVNGSYIHWRHLLVVKLLKYQSNVDAFLLEQLSSHNILHSADNVTGFEANFEVSR